jgi:UDPglucose 6-dehydrogenase
MAELHGAHPQLLRAVMEINMAQRRAVVRWLRHALHDLNEKTIGVLGLAFKPNTDDVRESPAIDVIHMLQHEGAQIRVYDPQAMPTAQRQLSDMVFCRDAYDVAEGCDALILATEWEDFRFLDWSRLRHVMHGDLFVDGRNFYDPETLTQAGFRYRAIGRGRVSF